MAFNFDGWPDSDQKDEKPFNRLLPFHRIRVPVNQIIPFRGPTPSNPNRPPTEKIISGDGFEMGARSTKDYDGKFGENLGKELADAVENMFPPLKLIPAATSALAKLAGLFGLKSVADALDGFDPIAELFKAIGRNVDAAMVEGFQRSIPAWVPTFDERFAPNNQFLELDGVLVLSHQRSDSVPFWQWHRWYDWHFAVAPSGVFTEMVGFGNTHRDDDNEVGNAGSKFLPYHREGLPASGGLSAGSIADCEWDIGALGTRTGPVRAHAGNEDRFPVFFDQLQPRVKHNWLWPMAGMMFWAIGRSVYDCAHSSKDNANRTRNDKRVQGTRRSEDERVARGVHLNQLHPLKALATARWEAFQFKENPKPVPAIQFMFYANTHLSSAGFFDKDNPSRPRFTPIGDQDYEFIVDLPDPVVTSKSEYPVGHTPEFALNTLVLQPRLVIDADFKPFQRSAADGVFEDQNDREKNELTVAQGPAPIVTIFNQKPGVPPQQALVRIPLKGNVSDSINAYGVLLSIGWQDPDSVHASQVKKVTVHLKSILPAKSSSDGEWCLNIGVNGRWCQYRFKAETTDLIDIASISDGPVKIEMLLAEEDFVMVAVHGFEEDPFDDVIRQKPEFPAGQKRPNKKAPSLPSPAQALSNPALIGKFKADMLERFKVMDDRLLRKHADARVPTGPPNSSGTIPTTLIKVPLVGDEIDWTKDIDTDDDAVASDVARAMFLRMALGNRFDANDLLGMINPNMGDPANKNRKSGPRSQDSTDTPNPLVVKDLAKDPGIGKPKACQLSAYKSDVFGRMASMGFDPTEHEYKLFYDVTVEDLPKDK